jgi:hypothetical protein
MLAAACTLLIINRIQSHNVLWWISESCSVCRSRANPAKGPGRSRIKKPVEREGQFITAKGGGGLPVNVPPRLRARAGSMSRYQPRVHRERRHGPARPDRSPEAQPQLALRGLRPACNAPAGIIVEIARGIGRNDVSKTVYNALNCSWATQGFRKTSRFSQEFARRSGAGKCLARRIGRKGGGKTERDRPGGRCGEERRGGWVVRWPEGSGRKDREGTGQNNVHCSCNIIWSDVGFVCPARSFSVDKVCLSQYLDSLFAYFLLGPSKMLVSGHSIFQCSS